MCEITVTRPITDTTCVDTGNNIKDKHNIKTRDKLQANTREIKYINT
jgi:hypothetical protein